MHRTRRPPAAALIALLLAGTAAAAPVHTTYLWHMHQPIYWPDRSAWTPARYETAYETITLGHSENDVFSIFDKDDRVHDYQDYPRTAVSSILDLPDAGAQVSFAAALAENVGSLAAAGWNGGRYAPAWYAPYREARSWTTSGGRPRLEPVIVAAHHPIAPLMDERALAMELAVAKAAYAAAWGDSAYSLGFFPAEMCFSERMIPALVAAGIEWTIVADIHLSRACADYPWQANEDNCDPPNPADRINPARGYYESISISRGVTVKTPPPWGFRPHRARWVDPETGAAAEIVVVPAANAMSWNEGYGLYGTGEVDAIAPYNDPSHPMLVLFAHDGDNAWSGGYSYYNENVTGFSHAAAAKGYEPTTVAEYLADHPPATGDYVHVEDGGWVNADGDFGSPQFINWNWPLFDAAGVFDIPGGWAEDERNWAVLTAAQNRVETAEALAGAAPDPARVWNPAAPGATDVEKAWHHLLSGYESGYMYYGTSLDMEIKATLAANAALLYAEPIIAAAGEADPVSPTIWLPQRLPWNPGGRGGGSLWGYPGGDGAPMPSDFHVWTFVHDVSGLARVDLRYRIDVDGENPMTSDQNETFAGGPEVGSWQTLPMNRRVFPAENVHNDPSIDFTVMPDRIADQYWAEMTGFDEVLIDYFVEAEDSSGNVERSPIQHVWVGVAVAEPDHVIDGDLDGGAVLAAENNEIHLYADWDGEFLYVAMEGVGADLLGDHFVLVGTALAPPVSAPWAKSGTVAGRMLFLAGEDDNNWCGWFDAGESVLSGSVACASASWLEGTVRLADRLGEPLPDGVWLAAVAYATPDGGPLAAQAPAGNADGDVDAAEYVWLPLSVTAADPALPAAPTLAPPWPNPFNGSARIAFTLPRGGRIEVAIHDALGRAIRRLAGGFRGAGRHEIAWDGRDEAGRRAAAGVYFVRLSGGGARLSRKIVVVR
ncbi:MAG: T9SS type A sorting domain-containing protein [Candidatus Krumholzibacteriota bacterium]|nr:T9SS type A sorting domain-containing protein [Candidatus Krumholzibacteriota bacterium]